MMSRFVLWLGTGTLILILGASEGAAAAKPSGAPIQRRPIRKAATTMDNTARMDANNLDMFVTNHGSFAYDLTTSGPGLIYPKGSTHSVVLAAGLWIGAKVAGDTRIAIGEYSQEFTPGPMAGGTFQPDNPRFKSYKITRGDVTSSDYLNWPVEDGAPVDSVDSNGYPVGKPALLGDAMIWSVYNDADPTLHTNDAGSTEPLGVEVKQATFAFNRAGALGNIIFIRYTILNKGGNQLDDMFVSAWSDPDLGGFTDDLVGCDTTLSVGFCYNATNADGQYGSAPPAVGFDFFRGPIVPSGTPGVNDTLGMSSFNKYINGTDPHNFGETYNYMLGLNADGSPVHVNGDPLQPITKFQVPGDPVAFTGWLDSNPADRRMMLSTGPFSMAPGDSQEITIAIIVGQGTDRLSSISDLKSKDAVAQLVFDLGNPALTRHPSLWLATPTSILVAWQTDVASPGAVLYGETPSLGSQASSAVSGTSHAVSLTGLNPGTKYWYQIASGFHPLTAGDDTLRTAPSGTAPFRFAAFGDCGTGTANQTAVAAVVDASNPDIGIIMGDVIYPGGEAANFTPRYFTPYRPTIRRSVFYPVVGNHDVVTSNGQPFLDAFYLPHNNPLDSEKYYSFDYSNVHFVALDSNQSTAPGGEMATWLTGDLAATTQRWKIVYFHHPPYSSSTTHGSDLTIRANLEPIFQTYEVDLVFTGHDHDYERTYPVSGGTPVNIGQEPNYKDPGAPIYFVSGGGGQTLYALGAAPSWRAYAQSVFHTMVVDVAGDSIHAQAIDTNGATIDEMTLTKSASTAVQIASFTAEPDPEGIRLRWRTAGSATDVGFHVYRGVSDDAISERVNRGGPIRGGPEFTYVDRSALPEQTYFYSLGAIDAQGREEPVGLVQASRAGPLRFSVRRPYPNPSGGAIEMSIVLPGASHVRVEVVDIAGRRVRTLARENLDPGLHTIRWDGKDGQGRAVASGIYFATVRAGEHSARVRLAVLR